MPVKWDLTGENISDALSEMEHLSFEVLHQSECHVLELSLVTSLIPENLQILRTVCWLGPYSREVIKAARKCE